MKKAAFVKGLMNTAIIAEGLERMNIFVTKKLIRVFRNHNAKLN